jgi:RNA polymerase sigma factor for flagellar operon FliA
MTTTTKAAQRRHDFDDLLEVAPANDVYRCSPDDPVAGMTLVKQIAASVARRLPSHIERDELVSLGALGWAEARQRFDATRGVPFAGFAAMRIRGAILDGLRQCDTLTRGERRRARAEETLTPARIVNNEEEVEAAAAPQNGDTSDILAQEEMFEELRTALATLPDRERYIITRHFFEEVPMKLIGAELGITESRISQIVTATVSRLRRNFGIAVLPRRPQKTSRPLKSRRPLPMIQVEQQIGVAS